MRLRIRMLACAVLALASWPGTAPAGFCFTTTEMDNGSIAVHEALGFDPGHLGTVRIVIASADDPINPVPADVGRIAPAFNSPEKVWADTIAVGVYDNGKNDTTPLSNWCLVVQVTTPITTVFAASSYGSAGTLGTIGPAARESTVASRLPLTVGFRTPPTWYSRSIS